MTDEKRTIAGRYTLDQLIGRGGMGDVYRGTDTHNGTVVAVKLLHPAIVEENPDIVDRFQREGEALRQLNHPNIVTIITAVEDNGEHFLVMEYVSGGSLRDLIDEQARLPIEAVLNVALDLADALTRAHRLHIIHRDIKPDNVLLAEDGTPRLTDFGVAHLGGRTRLTQTGSVIGTYAYLSPEACNGLELDERADIWSFGIMLFEMLTGRVPFHAGGTAAILTAILTKPAPDITRLRPEIPPALVNLIYRMLEKDRERRIPSVRVVGAELEAIIRQLDTPLRQMVIQSGQEPAIGSRFVTPPSDEDTSSDVPAMERSTPQQTHGFSLFPGQQAPAAQSGTQLPQHTPPGEYTGYYTPGGSPMSTAEIAVAQATTRKWQLITLMVIVTVLACSTVAVLALILGPTDENGSKTDDTIDTSITVPPVEPDQYMVLVAELDALGEEDRSITRYIRDDLISTLEEGVAFSSVRIREYPAAITSQRQADQIAEEYGAAVIVWGSYDNEVVDVNVQVGASTGFPDTTLPLETIQQSANVRVTMTDTRRESIAPQVLAVLGTVQSATGDVYGVMRTFATFDAINVTAATISGDTVAAYTHRYFQLHTNDTEQALIEIDGAIDEDVTNPISHALRSLALHHLGRLDDAHQAAETAARLAGPGWTVPLVLMSSTVNDPNESLAYISQVVNLRPNDWYALTSRGALYYIYGETDLARADLEAAIALEPESNFPYTFAALIAMSQGRFEDATGYIRTIVQEYPDPDLYARSVRAAVGEQDTFGDIVSAFVNLLLGRYAESAERANVALQSTGPVPDLLTISGLDYCNLGQYKEAEAAYDWALNVAGRMSMPQEQLVFTRLLRVDVLLKQGKPAAAAQDVTFIRMAGANPALVERFQNGDIGCENFFGSAAMLTSGPTTEFEMVIDPNAFEGLEPPDGDTANDPTATIEPVAPDEIMILVADLENVGGAGPHERDVARFIADDLRETLEDSAPFSNLRIRQYPGVITSDEEARAVAEAAGAVVIVWGNYTANLIEVEVQIGSLDSFTHNAFNRNALERMANVRLHMTDERAESVALNVLAVLDVVQNADGNGFETMRGGAIADVINVQPAEIMGSGVATYVHRYLVAGDAAADAQVIQQALSLDPGNPILFVYSSTVNQRLGQLDQARRDIDTAKRLAPAGWAMPLLFEAAVAEGEDVLPIFDQIIAMRPDDWFPLFFRGSIYYDAGREFPEALPLARADLEASIALDPPANFPYIYAALLALHEGRLQDADALINTIVTEFPDPTYMDRLVTATMGASNLNPYSLTLSAFVNQALGRHEEVITTTATAIEQFPQYTDFYVIQAISYCTLGDHAEAEAAFTTALEQDPTFMLLYLLRGAERLALGDDNGAEADLETLVDSDQANTYAPFISAVESGDLTCATFLGPDSRIASIVDAANQPPGPTGAIEPLEPSQNYRVVVADLEPLPGVEERDVARFILADLEQRIEDDIIYSQVSLSPYAGVITSQDEAKAVARETDATVVVWGNYGPDLIELEITLGTLDAFPHIIFARDVIEQVTNVRVHLTSERRQSVAQEVAGILALVALADGDEYQWMLDMVILDALDVTPGEIQGSTPAAYTHRAMQLYINDTPAAIEMFDDALVRAGGNPLLYAFRSMAQLRTGDVTAFDTDIATAARLGPEDWAMPLYAAEFESHDVALETYLEVANLRPDDWFVQFLIGMMYYDGQGDLERARAALEQSFALQPEANLPYVTAMLVALRQSDIAAAQTYAKVILTEFPDPELTNRAFNAIYGDTNAEAFTGLYFEAGTNLVLGQYNDVAGSISAALDVAFSGPVVPGQLGEDIISLSDVFFMQGVAYCTLADADAAIEAYSQAIKFGDFPLAHVMRAQMYETTLDIARADADYATARELGGAPVEVWVAAAESGAWTCQNLLDYTPAAE